MVVSDGLTGVGFKILFNVGDDKHTASILTYNKPTAGDSGVPTLTGAGSRYYIDVPEDDNYTGMGNVVAHITNVYKAILLVRQAPAD